MVDSETRIEKIEVTGENVLKYNYTLVNVLAQNVDTAQFRVAMWPGLLSMIKLDPDLKKLRESKTIMVYSYSDKNGKQISSFTITPAHYQ